VYAASIVVNSLLDTTTNADGVCTIREAIINANNDAATWTNCAAGTGADVISFSMAGTITITSYLPNITDVDGLTINGGSTVTISGNNAFRIVTVNANVPVTFQNITLMAGNGNNGAGGAIDNNGGDILLTNAVFSANVTTGAGDNGGAIQNRNNGTLIITDSTFSANQASAVGDSDGGAIYSTGAASSVSITDSLFDGNVSSDDGGALFINSGTLSVDNTQFLNHTNALIDNGGALYINGGTSTITNSTFTNNRAQSAGDDGGAIYVTGAATGVTISGSTFSGNISDDDGGAVFKAGTGTLTINSNTLFDGNYSTDDGGAILMNAGILNVDSVTFQNHNNTNIDNGGAINITAGTSTITNSTFTNNRAQSTGDDGGAIYVTGAATGVTISGSTFSGNISDDDGGAVFKAGAGTLTINSNTLFDGNYSTDDGGAILMSAGVLNVDSVTFQNHNNVNIDNGGAINITAGTSTITNSTFTNNRAQSTGDLGGAIYMTGAASSVTISNSGFTSNVADLDGGAIHLAGGTLNINNNTSFSSNLATRDGGAVSIAGIGLLTVASSTFTANTADDGGAIYSNATTVLTLTSTTFTSNLANGEADGDGGAITMNSTAAGSSLTITDGTFTNNISNDDGGALWINAEPVTINMSTFTGNQARSGNGAAEGGAIYNSANADATSIRLSTFTTNTVAATANVNAYGGALANYGTALVLANVTFSSNTITKSTAGAGNAQGGGVYVSVAAAETTAIHNVTFNGNSASESGGGTADGGSLYRNNGVVTVTNTILANSTENGAAGNCGGVITNGGNNISYPANDCAGFTNSDPLLGGITGSPAYFTLNIGSPAINTGESTATVCLNANTTNSTSQNGLSRPQPMAGNCDVGSYEAPIPATLTLLKVVVNDNGGLAADTAWTLNAVGPSNISGVEGSFAVTNAAVNPGTYTLSETSGPSGYSQTDLSCSGAADANPTDGLTIVLGETVTCTFTNNDVSPVLTLAKTTTNDNGGTALDTAWTLNAAGPTPISGTEGDVSITNATVNAGNYILTESGGPSGYTQTDLSCSGTADTNLADGLTLALGETVTCTFANNDVSPVLTLVKTTTTDNGGTALDTAWTLNAAGPTPISGVDGTVAITNAAVNAGIYTLIESGGPAGYTQTGLSCAGAADIDLADGLNLALGETVTCTFFNDDIAPTLTLEKTTTNDNGGTAVDTAWTLNAAGSTNISGIEGNPAVTNVIVSAGNYTLTETGGPAGYTQTAITCSGNDANGADGLDLDPGENVTCTFFNDDIGATLTLLKDVTNDNIGTAVDTDWTLTATGPTTISGVEGTAPVTGAGVSAGNYVLTESGPANYTQTANTCVGGTDANGADGLSLALGETVTCTFFNDDDVPVLLVPNVNSTPDTGDGSIAEGEVILNTLNISKLTVQFNWDADNPVGITDTDDVNNPNNYILLYSTTGTFNTPSCAVVAGGGVVAPDIRIPVTSVAYSNGGGSGPFIATLTLSTPLTNIGDYRLFVCGTTSIVLAADPTVVLSGNGTPGTDFTRNFRINADPGNGGGGTPIDDDDELTVAALPATGFAPNRVTILAEQPKELAYTSLGDLWIEIPALGVKSSIVGVPQTKEAEWNVTWLANNVGWLNGTAFPTWEGNSVLTAHVTNADGLGGPFANLTKLKFGDQIIVHAFGQKYIFELRNSRMVKPFSTSFAFEDLEDESYLTLITCQVYLPKSDTYLYRRVIRAVLVSVENE
jgi:LPXTG-site transpeptidase (sortase) family protein